MDIYACFEEDNDGYLSIYSNKHLYINMKGNLVQVRTTPQHRERPGGNSSVITYITKGIDGNESYKRPWEHCLWY